MAELKKVLITIPDSLLEEVDNLAITENLNRSKLIREAMRYYIKERRNYHIRETLIRGYEEMAEINLQLAEFAVESDNQAELGYKQKLTES